MGTSDQCSQTEVLQIWASRCFWDLYIAHIYICQQYVMVKSFLHRMSGRGTQGGLHQNCHQPGPTGPFLFISHTLRHKSLDVVRLDFEIGNWNSKFPTYFKYVAFPSPLGAK